MNKSNPSHGFSPSVVSKRFVIPQLDTIRVLAILCVFFHHLWKSVIVTPQGMIQQGLEPLFMAATGGVIIFNIISGFLLAMPYLGPERKPFTGYRQFMKKRFFRIVPPYYLALFIFTVANMLKFDYPLVPAISLLLQDLFFVNSLDYSNMYTNFSQFWYLGLLAQFYILFPFILWLFKRIPPTIAAITLIAFCWGGWLIYTWFFPAPPEAPPGVVENLMHFNLPGRLPEFVIGMWLASFWNPENAQIRRTVFQPTFAFFTACLGLYLVAGTPFISHMNLPCLHIYYVSLSLMAFLGLFVWSAAARAGGNPLTKSLAEHSYAVYIVHHPLFSYLGVMPSKVTHTLGNFALLSVLLLPLTYLAAKILDTVSAAIIKRISGKQ